VKPSAHCENNGVSHYVLSKIERGERFPTEVQLAKFAEYFDIPPDELIAKVIADKIFLEYGHQSAALQAVKIVKERMASYPKDRQ
jgi:transcriptional regulator with XRE-family HTH domain